MSRLIPLRLMVLLLACLLLAAVPLIWQARHREAAPTGRQTSPRRPTLVFEEAPSSFEESQVDVYIYLEATATVEHRYTNATATTDVLIHQATQTREAQLAATATTQAWVNTPAPGWPVWSAPTPTRAAAAAGRWLARQVTVGAAGG